MFPETRCPRCARPPPSGSSSSRSPAAPLLLTGRISFTSAQREQLRERWARGEAALVSLWERLSGVDANRGIVNELQKVATRAPHQAPRNGPERLVHAEYWHREAWVRIRQLVQARLAPLEPAPHEYLEVFWWLLEREYVPRIRLVASESLEDARAALIEVAYELWDAQRQDIPEDERWPGPRWARLDALAGRADESRGGPDGERVRGVSASSSSGTESAPRRCAGGGIRHAW